MVINLEKLNRFHWFEDEEGNVYETHENLPKDKDYFTYHVVNPCVYTETVDSYTCHPEVFHENNRFYQAMLNFRWFRRLMLKKHRKEMTFKPMFSSNTSFRSPFSQECIVAMVNSGDYTLEEAIYVYCKSCERCMNVLLHKYLNGKDGYIEFGKEWQNCNTECEWCKNLDGKCE